MLMDKTNAPLNLFNILPSLPRTVQVEHILTNTSDIDMNSLRILSLVYLKSSKGLLLKID